MPVRDQAKEKINTGELRAFSDDLRRNALGTETGTVCKADRGATTLRKQRTLTLPLDQTDRGG